VTGFAVALPAGVELGERPVWDDVDETLVWVDIPGGAVHRLDAAGLDTHVVLPGTVGAAGLRRGGGLIVACGSALRFLDADGHEDRDPIDVVLAPRTRFNDGACDPAGRFLVGTASTAGAIGAGVLLSVDRSGAVRTLLEGVTESNGLAWSPDGGVLYYVDSGGQAVRTYVYDAAAGTIGARGDLVVIDPADGVPDGLATDADGAVWVALWEGGAVRRYAPDGALLATLATPVSRPTCPGFGGAALDRLYVTTAREGLDAAGRAREPWAGHVLVCDPGVRGASAHLFDG
jgi:sugar lactone lactonase YvrE